ncbi:MAG: hypothetical protein OZ914_11920 [Anaerolineaceae bacterium]|nr:hypothetical protein [Anaerolineaceae bacterium]
MDSRWLGRCREGDSLAIERLAQTHQQDVCRLAFSIFDDADDTTQEVFIAALRALDLLSQDDQFIAFNMAFNDQNNLYIVNVTEALKDPSAYPAKIPLGASELVFPSSWQPVS